MLVIKMKKFLLTYSIFIIGCPKKEIQELKTNDYEYVDFEIDEEDLDELPEAEDIEER